MKYINRLSDHLFVLSRHVNDGGKLDVLWEPGATSNAAVASSQRSQTEPEH